MIYTPIQQLGMSLLEGRHKSVYMTLCEFQGSISIYSMESSNPGQGECQEAILELKRKYGKVYGSPPLNPTAKHVFDKMGVEYKL